jgi:hypothetical protein
MILRTTSHDFTGGYSLQGYSESVIKLGNRPNWLLSSEQPINIVEILSFDTLPHDAVWDSASELVLAKLTATIISGVTVSEFSLSIKCDKLNDRKKTYFGAECEFSCLDDRSRISAKNKNAKLRLRTDAIVVISGFMKQIIRKIGSTIDF